MGEREEPSFWLNELLRQTAALLIPVVITLLNRLSECHAFEIVKAQAEQTQECRLHRTSRLLFSLAEYFASYLSTLSLASH